MQHASDLNVMFVTAIELMGKCPEHAATIQQDIVHMAVLAHQEALMRSRCGYKGCSWEYACEVGVAIRKFVLYKPVIGM